ncbi:response regulator [Flavobacterium sedimenticola]|uniref:Response regulator n=1 Tax=Flavobacterium sedimenticola TaxID=3043286 RepID=A0ABT6XNZ3_9FLAO|nr:response regulator [Flavobacterium sedimenticola]MDI9256812.1 response regulator [Flavobacterium sedimenticola]
MENLKIHVLVVEDNPGDYLLIEENLHDKFEQVTIDHCTDYQSVLEKFTPETIYSIILLDFNLPDLDGIDLVDKIQSVAQGTPIIILTGYSNIKMARESLAKGVSDFLIKDEINAEILYKSIIYALERKKFMYEQNKSKEVYQHLFNFTPQPLWLYDAENLIFLDVNEAAVRKYGYSRDEFLKMTIRDIRPKEELKNLNQQLAKTEEERKQAFSGIYTHKLKSGQHIQVEIYSGDMEYNGRKARIVLSNDITDKLNHLQTIEGQNMKLKKIAWTQSHIVRAPISRILGILNLIEMLSYDSKEMPFLLQQLRVSTDEMDAIVREIVNESQLISFRDSNDE